LREQPAGAYNQRGQNEESASTETVLKKVVMAIGVIVAWLASNYWLLAVCRFVI